MRRNRVVILRPGSYRLTTTLDIPAVRLNHTAAEAQKIISGNIRD